MKKRICKIPLIFLFLLVLVLLFFVVSPVRLSAQSPVRDIVTFESYIYSDGKYDVSIEDVFLLPLHEKFQLEVREKSQWTQYGQRHLFQGGFVWVFGGGVYSEVIYGAAFDQNGNVSHEGFFDITYEGGRVLLNARYKMGFYPFVDAWFLLANVGGAYAFADPYTLQLKYYLGYDSNELWTHSLKMENKFTLNPYLKFNVIGVVGVTMAEPKIIIPWEVGFSYLCIISPHVQFTFFFNFVKPTETVWGIQNTASLNISF